MMNVEKSENSKYISKYVIPLVLLCLGTIFIFIYFILSKGYYITYNEENNVNYEVCLKENDYYDTKCIKPGNQYIASLIDYIPVNFHYNLLLPNNNLDYTYNYKIIVEFDVTDRDSEKVLFTKSEELYSSSDRQSSNGINIDYNTNIDYNKYNNLLNSFVTKYNLNDTTNFLKVSMNVNISNKLNIKELSTPKDSSITIPLTQKTVNIDINGTASNSNDNKILVTSSTSYLYLLIIGLIFIICSVIYIIIINYYIRKNRTLKEIYESRIKKITLSYDSYIQKITGDYPIGASRICKVESFKDMLEIKESSEKPLLMLENKEKTGTFFLIPVGEGVIYTYAIRIVDIEAEVKGTTAPDYDESDINRSNRNKKIYTKERIAKDIKYTTQIEILDDANAILGTKNSDQDLYDQLDKTSEYKFIISNKRK